MQSLSRTPITLSRLFFTELVVILRDTELLVSVTVASTVFVRVSGCHSDTLHGRTDTDYIVETEEA